MSDNPSLWRRIRNALRLAHIPALEEIFLSLRRQGKGRLDPGPEGEALHPAEGTREEGVGEGERAPKGESPPAPARPKFDLQTLHMPALKEIFAPFAGFWGRRRQRSRPSDDLLRYRQGEGDARERGPGEAVPPEPHAGRLPETGAGGPEEASPDVDRFFADLPDEVGEPGEVEIPEQVDQPRAETPLEQPDEPADEAQITAPESELHGVQAQDAGKADSEHEPPLAAPEPARPRFIFNLPKLQLPKVQLPGLRFHFSLPRFPGFGPRKREEAPDVEAPVSSTPEPEAFDRPLGWTQDELSKLGADTPVPGPWAPEYGGWPGPQGFDLMAAAIPPKPSPEPTSQGEEEDESVYGSPESEAEEVVDEVETAPEPVGSTAYVDRPTPPGPGPLAPEYAAWPGPGEQEEVPVAPPMAPSPGGRIPEEPRPARRLLPALRLPGLSFLFGGRRRGQEEPEAAVPAPEPPEVASQPEPDFAEPAFESRPGEVPAQAAMVEEPAPLREHPAPGPVGPEYSGWPGPTLGDELPAPAAWMPVAEPEPAVQVRERTGVLARIVALVLSWSPFSRRRRPVVVPAEMLPEPEAVSPAAAVEPEAEPEPRFRIKHEPEPKKLPQPDAFEVVASEQEPEDLTGRAAGSLLPGRLERLANALGGLRQRLKFPSLGLPVLGRRPRLPQPERPPEPLISQETVVRLGRPGEEPAEPVPLEPEPVTAEPVVPTLATYRRSGRRTGKLGKVGATSVPTFPAAGDVETPQYLVGYEIRPAPSRRSRRPRFAFFRLPRLGRPRLPRLRLPRLSGIPVVGPLAARALGRLRLSALEKWPVVGPPLSRMTSRLRLLNLAGIPVVGPVLARVASRISLPMLSLAKLHLLRPRLPQRLVETLSRLRPPTPRDAYRMAMEWMRAVLADPVRRFRLLLYGGAGFLAFLFFNTVFMGLSVNSSFCGACHSMKPEFNAWKRSSHAAITCYACHVEPGVYAFLYDHVTVGPAGLLAEFVTGYEKINAESEVGEHHISNENCERCHSPETRKFTTSNNLKMDHEKHLKKGVHCTQCHNRVAHLRAPGWTDNLTMRRCFRCHGEEKEPAYRGKAYAKAKPTCNKCHPEDFDLKPASHRQSDWAPARIAEIEYERPPSAPAFLESAEREKWELQYTKIRVANPPGKVKKVYAHALAAKADIGYCYMCHNKDNFCDQCHETTMPHQRPWFDRHGLQVVEYVREENAERRGLNGTANGTANGVVSVGTDDLFCTRCHNTPQLCVECHKQAVYPHPADWAPQHGEKAKIEEGAACWTCHRKDFCNGCHKGVQMPHGPLWLGQHRGYLRTRSANDCMVCHEKRQCEFCHSDHNVHSQHKIFRFAPFQPPPDLTPANGRSLRGIGTP